MARFTSMEHLRFLLFDVHQAGEIMAFERFAHLDPEQAWMIIESARLFAEQEMFPYYKVMDETPARYDGNGGVRSHPQLRNIIRKAAEQHWIGGSASFEHGGLQLPEMIFSTGHHLFQAANNGVQGYLGLSGGAAGLITQFGTREQVEAYVPKIFSGEWQGTMAMTEPQAGSSLSDITSSAIPAAEGHFMIRGQKIFISGGQHDACDNFIHLTLARIAGAPAGVKGISLFIVPKYRPMPDGSLEYNDVYCAGDFQKMGQRGYATAHLSFGDNDNCRGFLIGEPHKGLAYMFQMMNGARISVGQSAASVAMAAYQASLQYAKERPQGRPASEKDPARAPTLIINHADVQRMLLTQKAIAEGALSLCMECNRLYDLTHVIRGEEREKYFLLLEILTPIVKTYASEQASRSAALAIQTLGGYGYTTDFPVQQHYRDLKIMSLYEGTTGIQSIDLLGRKVTMEKGKALQFLTEAMQDTIATASGYAELEPCAMALATEIKRLNGVAHHLQQFAAKGEVDRYLADAAVFMEMASYQVIAWQWLKLSVVAAQKLAAGDFSTHTAVFFKSKIHTMSFFFRYELVHAAACETSLLQAVQLTNITDYTMFD